MPTRPAANTPKLQSLGIALDIVEALAEVPELGVSELARRVGIAKSTAHRTCAVLADRGLLDRTASGYRLGLRFVEYGSLARERTAVGDRGLPLLVELRNALGETVQIGVSAGADVVYVERVEGRQALRYSTNARRSPIHRSSAGKVLAAFDPKMVDARLRAGLPPSTGYTVSKRCTLPSSQWKTQQRPSCCSEVAGGSTVTPAMRAAQEGADQFPMLSKPYSIAQIVRPSRVFATSTSLARLPWVLARSRKAAVISS